MQIRVKVTVLLYYFQYCHFHSTTTTGDITGSSSTSKTQESSTVATIQNAKAGQPQAVLESGVKAQKTAVRATLPQTGDDNTRSMSMSVAGAILIAVTGLIAGAQKIGGIKKLFNR
ncbi:LPXTG cell wall anchor domain-containing protein [Liquorilactobacillus satsumensis]|nr:LPXTG cell wall anchor domain-containing protein [Liquorilactobacillus satsumensis]MCP9372690.1 LPXTG cell wall anchor domain-containing protein [Liquorilactobacillus satsumensis]